MTLAAILVALSAPIATAQESFGREDVIGLAPDDVGVEDIGRLFTREFRPLVGSTNSVLSDPSNVRVGQQGRTHRELREVTTQAEVSANASVWGFTASGSTENATQHAYFRVVEVTELHTLDDRLAIPPAPGGAEWYVSAVYVGRLYEMHFWGSAQAVSGAIGGGFGPLSGSIEAFARESQLQFRARTIGLEPTDGQAIFASSESEIAERYRAVGSPRPILVRYSRVPRASRPVADANRPRRVTLVSVEFPATNPAINAGWDPGVNPPDIMVRVRHGGHMLVDAFGGTDRNPAQLDRLIGASLIVTPEDPLMFEFFDRELMSHDQARSLIVATLPDEDTDEFRPPPGTAGVRVVLRVGI